MVNEETSPAAQSYIAVMMSFVQGLYRVWSAEAASARLVCALLKFRLSGRAGLDGEGGDALKELDAIPYSSYDSLEYVTDVAHLVYATTLLDTFLSDTTMFLFLMFPSAMGKNQQVPLRTLIDAASRNEALTRAAAARTRDVSYLPFDARIELLRETFGLSIAMDSNTFEALAHYSSVRNTAVHDQGIFELRLNDSGQVDFRQKTCLRHPTRIKRDDAAKAIEAYERVATAVAEAVMTHILKVPHHPALQVMLARARRIESAISAMMPAGTKNAPPQPTGTGDVSKDGTTE